MNTVEAYIQLTPDLVSDDGQVRVESTERFLRSCLADFAVSTPGPFRYCRGVNNPRQKFRRRRCRDGTASSLRRKARHAPAFRLY